MKLYNTLSRQIETIQPQRPPEVTVYTCGPTVYAYPHIGNWFTFIRYDLLIRSLKASNLQTKWVLNITDVGHLVSDADEGEDKLEKGARAESKTAWEIADFYSDYFIKSLGKLNITKPDYLPKATEHIKEQIELIQKLQSKGFTYTIDDGVYYETSKFRHYADFAQLDVDEQQATARVEHNPQKHSPTDFALWKLSPSGSKRDMEWDSPWGKGFPGWHIECSAMSMKYLGETLDIHAGGIDHLPVHHTNEIAQSEAVTGKRYANYWMHTNHVTVEGEKISKSIGNTILLEDIVGKGLDLMAFRLHVFESHYRTQSKFSWESLESAQRRLKALQSLADLRWQPKPAARATLNFKAEAARLLEHLQNDLDTPAVMARLSYIQDSLEASLLKKDELPDFLEFLTKTDAVLGLELINRSDITVNQKVLLEKREEARAAKSWDLADQLREQLETQKIGVRDTPHGAIWYRL